MNISINNQVAIIPSQYNAWKRSQSYSWMRWTRLKADETLWKVVAEINVYEWGQCYKLTSAGLTITVPVRLCKPVNVNG